MRRKSCLTFLLNSNHQINFKSKSAIRSGNIKKKEKKQYSTFSCGKGEGVFALVLPRRTTFWTITLIIILCFAAPSYFILKYSMSDFSDKFVFVRLSLQQPLDFKQILLTLFFIDSFKTSQLLFFFFFLLLHSHVREELGHPAWNKTMLPTGWPLAAFVLPALGSRGARGRGVQHAGGTLVARRGHTAPHASSSANHLPISLGGRGRGRQALGASRSAEV